ncbi:MAG: hypothetical protein IT319_15825, partial [Anaerolineae bacterium]|nr:hypothetical protein [Anaerolineae bacterium]
SLLSPVFTLLWLAGIALYGVVNAVFSLRAAPPGEPGTLLRIPVVFLTIHLAWGVGFWVGWLRSGEG